MGKLQSAAQTTTPQVDQEAPTTASGELTGLQAELMRAQQLAGAGNAYVQDQLNQQAAASVEAVQAATAEAVVVSQSPESEVADVEQAIEEVEVAVEGAEEGGGITGDAPPSDAGGAPEEVAVEAATGTEEAVAPESAAPAHAETGGETLDARTEVKKEFGKVYRSTSAAETDAWLDALQAREATEPELAGLAAELRAWTLEKRAAKAAKEAATTATAPPAATATDAAPSATTPDAPVEEPGGLWSILAGIKGVMSAAWEGLKSIPARISSWWSALWADEGTEQTTQPGEALLGGSDQGAVVDTNTSNADATTPPDVFPARTETGWMVVRDANAILRQGGDFKAVTPARTLPLGASVRVIQGSGPSGTLYVQVETAPGAAEPVLASDNLWTAKGNLGHGGADHKLGNEAKDEADKSSADTVRDKLPPGRNPGASPYTWRYGSDFATTLEGVTIKSSLLDKVIRMAEWAIANDMVTGDIELGSGMRSPATAHQWATAYQIQYGGDVTQEALEALPGGKDMDGNLWWKEGWTMEDAKRQANRTRSSDAIAAPGYPKGDPRRAPLNDRSPVSNHCGGEAIDVTFHWRRKGKDASTNDSHEWGWPEIYALYGLKRPVKSEHWHVEESSKALDAEASAD